MDNLLCFEQEYFDHAKSPMSYVDQVLLRDKNLDNLLAVEEQYVLSADYFGNHFQRELRPSMRKLVVDWMFEVSIFHISRFQNQTICISIARIYP